MSLSSGWYVDQGGRRWFCVQRTLDGGMESVSCDSDDGWFTAASPSTFKAWRWREETVLTDAGRAALQTPRSYP